MNEGAVKEEQKGASSGRVGENDLLIVGPGVLGRLVAEQWRQVLINLVLSVVSILMETKSKGYVFGKGIFLFEKNRLL